jgi:hypothetical protein
MADQETRNAADIAVLADRLTDLRSVVDRLGLAVEVAQGTIANQGAVLGTLEGLATLVDELTQRFNAIFGPPDDPTGLQFYTPIVTPRFWLLEGTDREQAIARLRAWVTEVYSPTFGHVAATLPECWESHPLILTLLDIASELHSCLYLQPRRNQGMLAGQAEYFTRIIPALAQLMEKDTAVCRQIHGEVNGWIRGVTPWR